MIFLKILWKSWDSNQHQKRKTQKIENPISVLDLHDSDLSGFLSDR